MWGLCKYKICLGAPKLTNSWITFLQYGLLIPVVNLPSENVPAPPSPNWTLDKVFNFPVFKKDSTSFFLSSTVFPCSIIIGFIPFCTNVRAAKRPAGPAPTITGAYLLFLFTSIFGKVVELIFSYFLYFCSSLTSKSIE